MTQIPDAPDIRRTMETGYPYPVKPPALCDRCGEELGEISYEVEGQLICKECFKDWLDDWFSTNPEQIARALEIPIFHQV